jgi:hypothetical protein
VVGEAFENGVYGFPTYFDSPLVQFYLFRKQSRFSFSFLCVDVAP